MRTEKLDRLISALGNPMHQVRLPDDQNQQKVQSDSVKQSYFANDDAVKIDSSLYASQMDDVEQSQRQAKIDRIASQVRDGTYYPSSEAVSVAFIKELGI